MAPVAVFSNSGVPPNTVYVDSPQELNILSLLQIYSGSQGKQKSLSLDGRKEMIANWKMAVERCTVTKERDVTCQEGIHLYENS